MKIKNITKTTFLCLIHIEAFSLLHFCPNALVLKEVQYSTLHWLPLLKWHRRSCSEEQVLVCVGGRGVRGWGCKDVFQIFKRRFIAYMLKIGGKMKVFMLKSVSYNCSMLNLNVALVWLWKWSRHTPPPPHPCTAHPMPSNRTKDVTVLHKGQIRLLCQYTMKKYHFVVMYSQWAHLH